MKNQAIKYAMVGGAALALLLLGGGPARRLDAKDKGTQVNPNDPTYRLYSLADAKFNGKLEDFCVLADLVNDPKNPGQHQQHVISLEYNKDRGFGKLSIHVRTVAELTPEQLKACSPCRPSTSVRPTLPSSSRPMRARLAGQVTSILRLPPTAVRCPPPRLRPRCSRSTSCC